MVVNTAVECVLPTQKTGEDKSWCEQKFLMIGPPKIGKSKFWSYGDKTLYLQTEAGLGHLDVMKFAVNRWADFMTVGSALAKAKDNFPYDAIVIDTLDNMIRYAGGS